MKRSDELVDTNSALVYEYIDSIDMDSLSISFCERVDEKSRVRDFDRQKHDYLELIYYPDGKVLINVPGKTYDHPLKDLISCQPQETPQGRLNRQFQQEIIYIGVNFHSKYCMGSSFELSDQSRRLRWLFAQIYDEYVKKEENYEPLVKTYLSAMFQLIKRHFKSIESKADDTVSRCMRYIHEHFAENITMKKLAATAYVSPSYLTRLFKTDLGVPPINYIIDYRIEAAKQLLRAGEASITEIAESAGFGDQKYFSRVFRKRMGISPRSYRKAYND